MSCFDPDDFMIHLLRLVDCDYATNPDHPTIKCLAACGYDYGYDLFNLNDEEVSRLSYVVDRDSYDSPLIATLPRAYQVRLLAIKAYRDHFEALHRRVMTEEDWMQVTKSVMNGFIMRGGILPPTPTNPTSPTSAPLP